MTEPVRSTRHTVSASGFANPLTLAANAEDASYVRVYADDTLLTLGVDYTLAGVGDTGDLDAIAGIEVTIEDPGDFDVTSFTAEYAPLLDQDADVSSGGRFGAIFEAALDAIARRTQFLGGLLDRSLRLPVSATGVSITLPTPDPGLALKWNSAGTGLTNSYADPDSDELVANVAYAAASAASAVDSAASAAAALVSENAASASAADAEASAILAAAASGDTATVLAAIETVKLPIGGSVLYNGRSAPTGYLKENAAAVSRATYDDLWAALHTEATVTITIATPGVVTWTSHGLSAGDTVRFTTTGALPTGLAAGTTYYVISAGLAANSFRLATSAGGSAINTTGSQSGVHTALNAPHGYGDGTTTFNVPESRGEFVRGFDDGRGIDSARIFGSAQSEMIGPHTHTATASTGGAHTHVLDLPRRYGANDNTDGNNNPGFDAGDQRPSSSDPQTTSSNGDHTHTITVATNSGTENRPRNVAKLYCVKY